jgi:hypothetical protein
VYANIEHIVGLSTTDVEYRFGKSRTYLTTHELAPCSGSQFGDIQRDRARWIDSAAATCRDVLPRGRVQRQ